MSPEGRAVALLPSVGRPAGAKAPEDDGSRVGSSAEVELLVTATWTVAVRIGSFEPSVREILQEAGISTKAFYRHFRSKDELLLVALEAGSVRLAEYIEDKMAAFDVPLPRIGVWIEGFVQQPVVPQAARRTLLWSLGVGRLANVYPEHFDHSQALVIDPLEREIAAAVASGVARSPSPAKDARVIFGYTMDAVRQHLVRRTEPDQATIRQLLDFTYRALGASPTD